MRMNEIGNQSTKLFVILQGEELSSEEVFQRLQAATETTSVDSGLRIQVGDESPLLKGFQAQSGGNRRLWFRLADVDNQKKVVVNRLRESLGWRMCAYWGLARDDDFLPPWPGDMIVVRGEKEARSSRLRINFFLHFLDIATIAAVLFFARTMDATYQYLAWGVCAAVCALGVAKHLLSRLSPKATLTTYAMMSCLELAIILGYAGVGSRLGPIKVGSFELPWFVFFTALIFSSTLIGQFLFPTRGKDVSASDVVWIGAVYTKKQFLERASRACCIACGSDLVGLQTCKCPECGLENYYLTDRPDARPERRGQGKFV